ncbi:MAG: SPOR domain-containing protein [Candidatus Omnitrophota bacterium]
MEKQEHSQLDFFSQSQGEAGLSQPKPRIDLLGSMRSHEKKILLIISFLIVGAVSFSLGVEKGKRIASLAPLKTNPTFDIAKSNIARPAVLPAKQQAPAPKAQTAYTRIAPLAAKTNITLQAYTVQIASYLSRNSAETEALAFRKRGLSPLIISKGKYTVLCVGNFSSRESAQLLLSELKKQKKYQDCTIRRL